MKYETRRKLFGLLFTAPWIIGFAVFTAYPIIQTFIYSFNKVSFHPTDGVEQQFIGLQNYTQVLFADPDFNIQIPVYLRQMFFMVPMVVVFSLLLALALNAKILFRRAFRAVFFLPVIIMSGPILKHITSMGATELPGAGDFFVFQFISGSLPAAVSAPVMYIVQNIVLIFWFSGVQILIFLSGLQKVDGSIYEAAMVDGASAWQKFWKITVPVLKPFIFLIAVYTVVDVSFSPLNPFISIIVNGRNEPSRGYGFSSAASWLYFLFILLLVFITTALLGRGEKEIKRKKRVKR